MKAKPVRDGVRASEVFLTPRDGATLQAALCNRFPSISAETWTRRIAEGSILDTNNQSLPPNFPVAQGLHVYYFRSTGSERHIEGPIRILYQDAHVLVADKPHFLPVAPVGAFVQETLLTRLIVTTGLGVLSPLHRLDKDTAGLVLFSVSPQTRGMFQALFRQRAVTKRYEAIAPALPGLAMPHTIENRLADDPTHFMKMAIVPGAVNAKTIIERIATNGALTHYRLRPETGQRHQLRVHMAALGAPIVNDRIYPTLQPQTIKEDFTRPLQLLAKAITFVDPISKQVRTFESEFCLQL